MGRIGLADLAQGAAALLWPARCVLCGRPAAGDGLAAGLCPDHACALRGLSDPCPVCATAGGAEVCEACPSWGEEVAGSVCAWAYGGAGREMVLAAKAGRSAAATTLGRMLGHALEERGWPDGDWCAVPVPLAPRRRRERGFNQSERIARGAGLDGVLRARLLVRTRETAPQGSAGAPSRRVNVAGAFTVPPRQVRRLAGRSVLLVDDVLTTGATVRACAKTLRRAGSGPVHACAPLRG